MFSTPRRMRLYTNPLPSSAEYAAFERMFENPSKAFFNISNEAKKQGGWDERTEQGTLFAILRGPFAGTYIFGRPRVTYMPKFETMMSPLGRSASLVRWKDAQVKALLKDLPAVIFAARAAEAGTSLDEAIDLEKVLTKHAIKRDELAIAELEGALRRDPSQQVVHGFDAEDDDVYIGRTPAQTRARIAAFKKRIEDMKAHPVRDTAPGGMAFSKAEQIYILSQAGGVDFDAVIAAIKEKPKRLLAFEDLFNVPRRREERARYARALLTTFSPNEAMKAQYPRVESVTTFAGRDAASDPALIRYAFANWQSWLQRAEELGAEGQHQPLPGDLPDAVLTPAQRRTAVRRRGAESILHEASAFKHLKVPAATFKDVVKRYSLADMRRIKDTLNMASRPQVREALAETVEGRRVIQHIADMDWREVLRDHDRVAALQNEIWHRDVHTDAADDPALERFHSRGKAFNLPEGVRPLTKKEEFFTEGSEMGHCVGGYFFQRQSWCFAFLAPDGKRATLELGKRGDVRQFYGPGNREPSPANKALLDQFLKTNADNIARMKTGQFPPPDETKAIVEQHPVPQQNPRYGR